jgi:hypothetical protein
VRYISVRLPCQTENEEEGKKKDLLTLYHCCSLNFLKKYDCFKDSSCDEQVGEMPGLYEGAGPVPRLPPLHQVLVVQPGTVELAKNTQERKIFFINVRWRRFCYGACCKM